MSTLALYSDDDRAGTARWSAASAIVVAFHAALIAVILAWYKPPSTAGAALPMIMVDLAPSSSAPGNQIVDVPPGPDMQQADAPPPPPPEAAQQQEAVQEQLPPTPAQPSPVVEAPAQREVAPPPPNPEPVNPQPAKTMPEPAKPPVKPKPVHAQTNKPSEKPPAPRTSAAPKAERRAPSMSAPSAVAGATAAAALASYNQLVAAHLQRFKQYPSSSKAAGEQGVSRVSFTLSRGGQVLSDRLAGSSGYPALDAETVAMVRRAQPFPPMPPEVKRASIDFTVPIRFSGR